LRASAALAGIATRSLAAAPSRVTPAQYRLLVLLDSRGPQMPSAVAGELGAVPSSVTRLCDRLVAKGLIFRSTSAENRRQVVLSTSSAGRSVVEAVSVARRREVQRVVRTIRRGRRQSAIDALNEFAVAAGGVSEYPDCLLGWAR
jgi:DNA-binding MarR family transcriptional regulator